MPQFEPPLTPPLSAPPAAKPKKLLDQMADRMRVQHLSLRTERSYIASVLSLKACKAKWVARFYGSADRSWPNRQSTGR